MSTGIRTSRAVQVACAVVVVASACQAPPARPPLSPEARAEHDREVEAAYVRYVTLMKRARQDPGVLGEALRAAQKVLRLREEALGADDPNTGMAASNVSRTWAAMGRFREALTYGRWAVRAIETAGDPNHVELGRVYGELGHILRELGEMDEARLNLDRARRIARENYAADAPELMDVLGYEVAWHYDMGDYAAAARVLQRLVTIAENAFGPNAGVTLFRLQMLTRHHRDIGELELAERKAEDMYRRAEAGFGRDDANTAFALGEIASIRMRRGDFEGAVRRYHQQIRGLAKALGPKSASLALAWNDLGAIHMMRGDTRRARQAFKRSIQILEHAHGRDAAVLVLPLCNLALFEMNHDTKRALRIARRADRLDSRTGAPTPRPLEVLAEVHITRRELEPARTLSEAALRRVTQKYGTKHPLRVRSMQSLAYVDRLRGQTERARRMLLSAREIAASSGLAPMLVGDIDVDLAATAQVAGNAAEVRARLTSALRVESRLLSERLAFGSEQQKLQTVGRFALSPSRLISIAVAGPDADKQRALELVAQRKGATLDVMGQALAAVRRRGTPRDRQLLGEIASVRGQLATLALRGAGRQSKDAYDTLIARLDADARELEGKLSSAARNSLASPRFDLSAVQAALRPGEVWVEFALYRPWEPSKHWQKAWGEPHYAAWVTRSDGHPIMVALGPAATIDLEVKRLSEAARDEDLEPMDAADALGELLAPVVDAIGEASRVTISPDGPLNLVPWAIVPDASGRPLIETTTIRLVTSGRELLRKSAPPATGAPLLVADPRFDHQSGATGAGKRSVDLDKMTFGPLPDTRLEVNALKRLMPGATTLMGDSASEAALVGRAAPRVLHVATHGFFVGTRRNVVPHLSALSNRGSGALLENPLLRSGLALAGAAHRTGSGAGDDGILTALEMSAMDLSGTQLVTLSACETGLGDLRAGSGVHGLLRAIRLAGAETVVASLWNVDDEATRRLMLHFYRGLVAGKGRADALRDAQLMLRSEPETEHPMFWAAFQLTGRDGPLVVPGKSSGRPVPSEIPAAL